MTAALDYLKQMPVLWINVDGHTDRADQFMANSAHLFAGQLRVPAVPVVDALKEANEFVARVAWTRENADPFGWYNSLNVYRDGPFTRESRRAIEYARTQSLTLSVLKAVMHAQEAGYERFMLMEDDAVPRLDLLSTMPIPPVTADIAVWGGAYGSGAIKRDNQRYLDNEGPKWLKLDGKSKRFFTQAYELTQAGAAAIERSIREHFFAIDMSWWFAHHEVPSFVMQPSAFVQQGGSVRAMNHNPDREGVATR